MKKARKLLSLVLCLVMVLSFFPAAYAEGEGEGTIAPAAEPDRYDEGSIAPTAEEPVGADAPGSPEDGPDALPAADDPQEITASGECGENLTWTLENGVLTISGTGLMTNWSVNYGYPSDELPWYDHYDQICTVVIESGVTSIGDVAFAGLPALNTVEIPSTVTVIGECAFAQTNELSQITLPEGLEVIKRDAFSMCPKLTSLSIPASVSEFEGGFMGCRALTEILVAQGNAVYSSVKGVLYSADCSKVIACPPGKNGTLTIPEGTNTIGYGAYKSCRGLTDITMPSTLTTVEAGAFVYCHGLTSLTFPEKLTFLGETAVNGCQNLVSVSLPAGIESIESRNFSQCAKLTDIVFGGTKSRWEQVVQDYDRTAITVHCSDGDILAAGPDQCGDDLRWTLDADGVLTISGNGGMWDYSDIRSGGTPAPWIGEPWGTDDRVKSVVLEESVSSIGACAFNRCGALESVALPTSLAVIGEYAFSECSDLSEIRFPGSAPVIGKNAFLQMTATAYYPANDPTWTEDVRQSYGGNITWVAYEPEPDLIPGDINGDGELNNKDVTRLIRYIKYGDVEVDASMLDVNGDGEVNNKDVTRLIRYIKYGDVEIH